MADTLAVFQASMDFFEQGLAEDALPAEPAEAMLAEPTMDDGRAAGSSASLRVDVTGNAALTFSSGGAGAEASSSSGGASGDSATGAHSKGPEWRPTSAISGKGGDRPPVNRPSFARRAHASSSGTSKPGVTGKENVHNKSATSPRSPPPPPPPRGPSGVASTPSRRAAPTRALA